MMNIIIDDNYIVDMELYIEKSGKQFEDYLNQYLLLMNNLHSSGIAAGKTADAVAHFIEVAEQMQYLVGDLTENYSETVGNYIRQINEDDQDLFLIH
jgi:hypothetical protein